MTLLFLSELDDANWWSTELNKRLPELEVRIYPEMGDPADITYALAWKPKPGLLKTLPNLKAIFSLGAGVDHLFSDPDLPRAVPVVRMVDESLTKRMTEFVAWQVLDAHREGARLRRQQRDKVWEEVMTPLAERRTVGVMGLGVLGSDAARALAGLGFQVRGWSRSEKAIPGVACFHGADGRERFLADCEILVCLLPLTDDTEGIVNADLLAKLPKGAYVINAGRGPHVVDEDLLAALDSGHLRGATLDVFHTEPLPTSSRFWTHEKVFITPHIASLTDADSAADALAENIRRAEAGQPLPNVVDPAAGY